MNLAALIDTALERPGCSLEQPFHCDPALFNADLASVFNNQWLLAGHISQIPACRRLMGTYAGYDGGVTYLVFNYFSVVFGLNDFAVLVQFVPREVSNTDVWFTWLVNEDAAPGRDYDPEGITRFWDVTTNQDKQIAQDNQAGVNSSRYEPGPYSIQENYLPRFKRWYLDQFARQP